MWSVFFGVDAKYDHSHASPAENAFQMNISPLKYLQAASIFVLFAGFLAACGGNNAGAPPAAKVDGAAISQGAVTTAAPSGTDAQRKAQLEISIAEQLLANAAAKEKLDVDASVQASIETSKRQILARAYLAKRAAAQPKITEVDIKAFYDQHPELFAERKIYRLQEIAITVASDRVGDINKKLQGLKTFGERAAWLKKNDIVFTTGVVVKGAEEWPADLLANLSKMKDGTAFDMANPKGFSTLQLTGIEPQPLTLAQAQGQITRFISNQRVGDLWNQETKNLRTAAKIEYFAPYKAP